MSKLLNIAEVNINITIPRERLCVKDAVKDSLCCFVCHNFPVANLAQCAHCQKVFWEPHFYEAYLDECLTPCCQNEEGTLKSGLDHQYYNPNPVDAQGKGFEKKDSLITQLLNLKIKCCNVDWAYTADVIEMLKHERQCKNYERVRHHTNICCVTILPIFDHTSKTLLIYTN